MSAAGAGDAALATARVAFFFADFFAPPFFLAGAFFAGAFLPAFFDAFFLPFFFAMRVLLAPIHPQNASEALLCCARNYPKWSDSASQRAGTRPPLGLDSPEFYSPPVTFRSSSRFDVVVSDIDGCLAPESHAPMDSTTLLSIRAHNLAAIERRDRPVLTLCSGRPLPFAEALARMLANSVMPVICENGVWLYDPRNNTYLRDPAITPDHQRMVAEASRWVELKLGPRGVVIQPGKTSSIALYHDDTPFLRSLEGEVRSAFAAHGWTFRVSMTWLYINCDLPHVSKSTGIDRLVAMMGLDPNRLAGIGDTPADAAIADRVAYFCCPANASPGIKPRANYISPHEEAKGVLDILEHLRGV